MRPRVPRALTALTAATALTLVTRASAAAQTLTDGFIDPASPLAAAVRQLAGDGTLSGAWLYSGAPIRRSDLRDRLAELEDAGDTTPYARLRPTLDALAPAPGDVIWLRVNGGIQAARERGVLRAGTTVWDSARGWSYPGPHEAASPASLTEYAAIEAGLGGVTAAVSVRSDAPRRPTGLLTARMAGLDLWAGDSPLTFGAGEAGNVVLGPAATLRGAGLATGTPVPLPRPLRSLRAVVEVAQFDRSGSVVRPWFSAMRITVAPTDGLLLGASRAMIFGGKGNEPVTARNVAEALIGLTGVRGGKSSDFENQVASADFWWRSHVLGVPVVLRGEWGFDDMGFGWSHVPGQVVGIEVPSLPGVRWFGAGIEGARFAASCCGNPPWYRHGALGDGWTLDGTPLGRTLGGNGRETLAYARAILPRGVLQGTFGIRRRDAENLYAPTLEGRAHYLEASAQVPIAGRFLLSGRFFDERTRTRHIRSAELNWSVHVPGVRAAEAPLRLGHP